MDILEVDLVPLLQFSRRIREGWTMVDGYPLVPGDYAVLMREPVEDNHRNNLSRAAVWRNKIGMKKRRELARAE